MALKCAFMYLPLVSFVKKDYLISSLCCILELGITEGHEIAVADTTSPKPIIFRVYFE